MIAGRLTCWWPPLAIRVRRRWRALRMCRIFRLSVFIRMVALARRNICKWQLQMARIRTWWRLRVTLIIVKAVLNRFLRMRKCSGGWLRPTRSFPRPIQSTGAVCALRLFITSGVMLSCCARAVCNQAKALMWWCLLATLVTFWLLTMPRRWVCRLDG